MSPSSSIREDNEIVTESPATTSPTTQRPNQEPPAQCTSRTRRLKKGSLRDILRQNAGTSLFLRPIGWTDLHVSLLGVRFCELPVCDTPRPCIPPGSPPTQGHMRPSNTITKLSEALTEILLPSPSLTQPTTTATKTVLMTLWPAAFANPHPLPELHLYFGDKVYFDAVRVQALWNFPSNSPASSSQSSVATIATRPAESYRSSSSNATPHSTANLPMLCYIGKNLLASTRQNIFPVAIGPDNNPNIPVQRLQQLRRERFLPADPDQDPQFVGIFLAMAQRHFYTAPVRLSTREMYWQSRKGESSRPDSQDVKMRILSHDTERCEFLVYTGYVTAKFLDRFYDPSSAPCNEDGHVAGMKIMFTRVPIWPILGLRERLGKALGEDIVGPFDPKYMETWVEDAPASQSKPTESGARGANIKRKRGTPPTTESLDGNEPSIADKKRCLSGEGNRVGVAVSKLEKKIYI